jgi:trehalose-phosphatase
MKNSSSQTQPNIEGIPDFWQKVARARHRFLGLDYDGTLAPFRDSRMKAVAEPETLKAVRMIVQDPRTTLAVLSGRPLSELISLLPGLPVAMAGSHGWEVRHADGRSGDGGVSSIQREGLRQVLGLAIGEVSEDLIERKSSSVAFHTRPLPAELATSLEERIAELWRPVVNRHEMELRRFNGGIEARALGHNKGSALRTLLEEVSPDALVVYIGDDDTDEDAFSAIGNRGYGIKVGEFAANTAAKGRVNNCEAVGVLLAAWAELVQ